METHVGTISAINGSLVVVPVTFADVANPNETVGFGKDFLVFRGPGLRGKKTNMRGDMFRLFFFVTFKPYPRTFSEQF